MLTELKRFNRNQKQSAKVRLNTGILPTIDMLSRDVIVVFR